MGSLRMDFTTSRSDEVTARPLIMGRSGVVTSGHHLATAAGFEVMRAGGNAVDAGVTAGIAINVLLFNLTSFTGVAPIVVYHAQTDTRMTLDGLGVWPELTDIDEIRRRGGDSLSEGIMRAVTPGAPDSWMTALERYGTKTLGEVLEPARELAREGAPVSRGVAADLGEREERLADMEPEAARIFFPGGRAPRAGQVLVQADLAETFGMLMDEEARARREGCSREEAIRRARDFFYRGPIAERISEFHRQSGGWMRLRDLAEHRVELAPPLHISYRGHDVYACGPWCQGPMLLQFLNVLDCFELEDMGHNCTEYLHLLVEAMDLVFADRENFYADPRHVEVPITGLLSRDYARERAALIPRERATGRMPDPGDPWRYEPGGRDREVIPVDVERYRAPGDDVKSDTSYVAAMDARGNIFSATPSDPVFWTPVVPGLGISCSGRGKQSRVEPGHPSGIAPGRRPRLTPNPALVMRGEEPIMALGCPGGDAQTQGMLQVLINMLHFGMNPQEAVEAPRVVTRNFPNSFAPHAYYPGRVDAEADLPGKVRDQLAAMGHDVYVVEKWAASSSRVHLAMKNPVDGTLLAGADPRAEGSAIGW